MNKFSFSSIVKNMLNENIYYRGINPNSEKRISTGNEFWDNNLFVSKDIDLARCYGKKIITYKTKPFAKITSEKSMRIKPKPEDNYLDYLCKCLKKAIDLGYDIIEFSRQGDVGTIIINPNSVEELQK